MKRALLGISIVCLYAGLTAGPAAAQTIPDDSAFDQYIEGTPGPGGEEAHPGGSEGEPLSPSAQRALEAQGPVGERTAALATATSKKIHHAPDRGADGGAGLGSVIDAIPWGFGLLLIIILAVTAGLAFALNHARRRAATPSAG